MTDKLTTEIIGFRQWQVDQDLHLCSTGVGGVWEPGDNTAECRADEMAHRVGVRGPRKRKHTAPAHDCQCGLYALYAPSFWYGEDRHQSPLALWLGGPERIYVAGLVAAWGRVEVHHTGFRAEHARVVAIAVPPERKRDAVIARAVAAAYGAPTVPQDELERVAGEFGQTVPEDLRPDEPPVAHYTQMMRILQGQSYPRRTPTQWIINSWRDAAKDDKPKPPEAEKTVADRIREIKKAQAYDPSAFLPKRKGGKA